MGRIAGRHFELGVPDFIMIETENDSAIIHEKK